MSVEAVVEARRRARLARETLSRDVELLKVRASPATLIADARQQAVSSVSGKPALVAAGVAALVAVAAIPPVRRTAGTLLRFGWRNRAAIGLLIRLKLRAGAPADRKKDQTR